MNRKIKLPSKEQTQMSLLVADNAELWFENMLLQMKLETTEKEIADLWFAIISGGI